MNVYLDGTPCPTSINWGANAVYHEDITGDLNYTTEFKAALRNAAPRRRRSVLPKLPELASEYPSGDVTGYIGQQRKEITASLTSAKTSTGQHASTSIRDSQVGARQIDEKSARFYTYESVSNGQDASRICKRPRRRTIYLPPDDTTLMRIDADFHAAINQQSSSLEEERDFKQVLEIDQDARHVSRSTSKRKSLAAAPKRAPLIPTLKPLQEMNNCFDLNGLDTGKENVAPGVGLGLKPNTNREISSKARRVSIFQSVSEEDQSINAKPNGPEMPRHISTSVGTVYNRQQPLPLENPSKADRNSVRRASMMNRRNSIYYGGCWKASTSSESCHKQTESPEIPPPKISSHKSTDPKIPYTVLEEDIQRPEMFEETWLSCQEVAIQQLLNRFLDAAKEERHERQPDRHDFRARTLDIYQSCDCAIVHKRLNASLLFGALNPPKDSVADICRLQTDVGLRKAFLDLWLNSYDLEALIAVAEVVVGRNVLPSPTPDSQLPRKTDEATKDRTRHTRVFIESCLLRNEDAQGRLELQDPVWCWRRTMLRSLMMVMLLDRAKENGLLYRTLFKSSSRIKTSRAVLAELCSLISPFLGDLIRPLAHLHYQLHHVQHPLSEYEYGISNLATDLRDGVQLTHIVELLRSPKPRIDVREDAHDTTLTKSRDNERTWPLSHALTVPCINRSQKARNVRVALSAMKGVFGVDKILEGIEAEDIVDGHREKTVSLLWSLVGKWGLQQLIDFVEVRREIRRLSVKSTMIEASAMKPAPNPKGSRLAGHTNLLQQWAHSIAHRRGLPVTNLTTSFSDGRVFAAIVDEYERFLPKRCLSRNQNTSQLTTRLKEIGCSDAFGKITPRILSMNECADHVMTANIFSCDNKERIFHQDFTVSALAFLCSRLLLASRRGIAASVILRAYRNWRRKISHRYWSADLTQCKINNAARVLQRNWRNHMSRKQHGNLLEQDRAVRREKKQDREQRFRKSEQHFDIWLP